MVHKSSRKTSGRASFHGGWISALGLLVLLCMISAQPLLAQDQTPSGDPQSAGDQQNPQVPAEAGGPQSDIGPYAIPKKKDAPPPPPPTEHPKKIEGMPDYTLHVSVPVVEVPVSVVAKDGTFISNLTQENFRITEDGTPQAISSFGISQAPITAVLLTEFAACNYVFTIDALRASYAFASQLKKDDWVAVEYFDLRPHILQDFTQDKGAVLRAINELQIPGFSETGVFQALFDTLDRVDRIEGRKYIILVSSGYDSFSRITYDQILKKIKATKDVTIYPISTGWLARTFAEARGGAPQCGPNVFRLTQLDYLQADNEMQTYAKMTGGKFYQPRFEAEYPEVFHDILGDIRNQYVIAYHPTNQAMDGTYRKLKVEVVAPDGGPLKVKDQKGKDIKFQIIARDGYTAKHTVE